MSNPQPAPAIAAAPPSASRGREWPRPSPSTDGGPSAPLALLTPGGGLRRTLRTRDIAAITFSCVVGSGIFLASSEVAGLAPSAALALAVWAGCGALCILGVVVMAPLVDRHPDAGGLYTLLRAHRHDELAFLYGWSAVLVVSSSVTAAFGSALGRLLASAIGALASAIVSTPDAAAAAGAAAANGSGAAAGAANLALLAAVGAIALAAFANARGIAVGRRVQNAFTVLKLGGLLLFGVTAFVYGLPAELQFSGTRRTDPLAASLAAIVIATWTFDGWTYAAFCGGEARSPAALRRGWVIGMTLVTMVYIGVNAAAYPWAGTSIARPGPPAILATTLTVTIALALAGSLHAVLLTGSRCIYAMARDGLLPAALGRLGVRTQVPVAAVITQAVLACLFLFVGGFYQLLSASVVANWLFYVSVARVSARLRTGRRAAWLAGLFCVGAAGIVLAVVVIEPRHAAMSVALIASGLPVYLWRRLIVRALRFPIANP